ncbi:MAG: hypothetical protein ACR2KF_05165 [Nitrososphaeraceae archaeon]
MGTIISQLLWLTSKILNVLSVFSRMGILTNKLILMAVVFAVGLFGMAAIETISISHEAQAAGCTILLGLLILL